ncbi:putative leucine-rich repeat domain, L domain-containing protein [Medicago truncatula]|uniref:Putative leucine-rich repeat domain, L domain-containing protein n=1 Tax=Medicago truncatula TaxID=3880 RepID=A0A396HYC6_MEDTR|nr:SCF E3 ubiquitin ligase complex F-box protein GRR1 [Medicago truncatula]RHN58309.1 putative leucine-rich repeat domain, L domain-containing protein [Medicago truncatula]
MDAAEFYLPDECWECIFNFLNDDDDDNHHRYLKSLSLVSKRFLSITNCLRFSLTIVWYPTRLFLGRFFQRYPNLTSLDLSCYYGDLNKLLFQISRFQLNLTSLNLSNRSTIPANGLQSFSQKISTLTSLKCSKMNSIKNTDLFLIANCFPLLEELDLSNPIRFNDNSNFEDEVEALSLTLFKLQKINLSSHTYMNDQLLFVLFKNCKLLREAIILNCHRITIKGIASAIRERPTLRSFELDRYAVVKLITPHFIDSLVSLTSLDLTSSNISNEFLSSIAMKGLPLTRLVLCNCTGYTYDGILCLLSKSKCLQHLDLQYTRFLNNEHLYDTYMVQLSSFLSNLISINLSHCGKLTKSTLFALAGNCPSLNDIKMEYTLIGKESAENLILS